MGVLKMPFFRINGLMVHMRLGGPKAKQPKPCVARIEIDGKACRCMALSGYLCDWRMFDGRTCDQPLCDEHAHQVGADRHLCPAHAALARDEAGKGQR